MTEGMTLVPISLYSKGGLIKVELGLGRGKKKYDKRADIKKRDVKRNIQRSLRIKV
jgi:SsrA-binding protein